MKGLCRGCIVRMKASSNMVGYGNHQCVSSYVEALGEVGFFGHNQLYKDYHIAEIVERPEDLVVAKPSTSDNKALDAIALLKEIKEHCDNGDRFLTYYSHPFYDRINAVLAQQQKA